MVFGKGNASETPAGSLDLNIPAARPFYRRPVVYATVVIALAFGGAFWVYSQNPQWLEGIVAEDAAGLGRLDDLPDGANPEDLAFLRGEFEAEVTPELIAPDGDGEAQPSLLEQFMQGQEDEASESEPSTPDLLEQLNADNPLLNPSQPDATTPATNPLAALLGVGNPNAAPLSAALNGGLSNTGNPLQDALNQMAVSEAAVTQAAEAEADTATTANSPQVGSRLGIDPYTGRPTNGQPAYGIPGQPNVPATAGGYDAFSPTQPLLPGQPAPTAIPSLPQRSQRRSLVTPLLAPSPSPAAVPGNAPNPATAVPGQQFTSPIRQQQQLRQNPTGTSNGFQRIGGGQIDSFGNPLGSSSQSR
ncbi:MAG: hypothetical protein HC838_13170 [Spirulinaceae cyanobacterium RM2_2_10]|nr:hypothetical protein [Spirulinaceae cyanobacterium SM2_1_0]NJO20795.1 hypothetical protein [Spirulinaceae cyanobacterium RM2_2_10]